MRHKEVCVCFQMLVFSLSWGFGTCWQAEFFIHCPALIDQILQWILNLTARYLLWHWCDSAYISFWENWDRERKLSLPSFSNMHVFLSPSFSLSLSLWGFFRCRTVREETVIWNWRQLPPHRICIGLRTSRNKRRDEKQKTGQSRQEEREKAKMTKNHGNISVGGRGKSKLTTAKIHIKLCEWQISSLAASSIKNLPTCLSVPLGVSAGFRSAVHQNAQSKTVGTT